MFQIHLGLRDALWALLAVIIAAGWLTRPRTVTDTVTRVVPLHVIRQGEPTADPSLLHRLATTAVKPETVLVTAPGADSTAGRFCAAVARADTAKPDTTRSPGAAPSGRPDSAGAPVGPVDGRLVLLSALKLSGRRLQLWGTRSDASAYSPILELDRRHPYLEATVSGDTAIVRQARSFLPWGLTMDAVAGAGVVATQCSAGPGVFLGLGLHR